MENQINYQKAEKRVEAKLGFYLHLFIYIMSSLIMVIVNLNFTKGPFWAMWPVLGWGFGIVFHAFGVFAFGEGSAMKEKMIEKELAKGKSKQQ